MAQAGSMKILSLWESWASFVARGYKKWETRSWPTSYRGPLAIHAAKTAEEIWSYRLKLSEAGIIENLDAPDDFPKEDRDWPLGCIVAVCVVTDCRPTAEVQPSRMEKALGDYTPGRFAWILENVRAVKPLPHRGMQGLKNLPAEVQSKLEFLQAA